jgi:hypothetical protein
MMLLQITLAAVAGLYLWDRLYWFVVRGKARNQGLFRDDRRENDQR